MHHYRRPFTFANGHQGASFVETPTPPAARQLEKCESVYSTRIQALAGYSLTAHAAWSRSTRRPNLAEDYLPVTPRSLTPALQKGSDREAAKDAGADWPSRTPDCEDAGRRACARERIADCEVEGVTENVSPRGARVITDSVCAPGKSCAWMHRRNV